MSGGSLLDEIGRLALTGVVLMGIAGCAAASASEGLAPGTLNRAALRASQPRSITVAQAPYVAFDAQTAPAGAAVFGIVGLGIGSAIADNDSVKLRGPGIKDPAIAIRAAILDRLARRFGLSITSQADARGDNGAPLASDLTLTIATSVWGIMPTRMGHYGVKYRGTLRLTDNRNHHVLAEGECTSLPVDGEDMPTFDELQANDGARLRATLKATADYCIDDYRKRILGLY